MPGATVWFTGSHVLATAKEIDSLFYYISWKSIYW